MSIEEWRRPPGFWDIMVSNKGAFQFRHITLAELRALDPTSRISNVNNRRGWTDERGYTGVRARPDGCAQASNQKLHRLIALAFLGPPPFPNAVVRHLNDVRSDNHVDNLAWGSQQDNVVDSVRNGNHAPASKTHCAYGHPLDQVYMKGRSGESVPQRGCLHCKRWRSRRSYHQAKAAKGITPKQSFAEWCAQYEAEHGVQLPPSN